MTRTATASSSPAAAASWCWKSWSTPRRAAPRSTARSSATAPPPTATTWWRPPARARCAACDQAIDGRQGRADRLHQPARHLDAGGRRQGDRGDPRGVRPGETCPPISATKSLTGHTQGAAGAQEAIYCLLMMNNGFICESANIDDPRPGLRRHADPARAAGQRQARARADRTPSASAAPTRPWS